MKGGGFVLVLVLVTGVTGDVGAARWAAAILAGVGRAFLRDLTVTAGVGGCLRLWLFFLVFGALMWRLRDLLTVTVSVAATATFALFACLASSAFMRSFWASNSLHLASVSLSFRVAGSVFGPGWTQEHEQDFGQTIMLGILLKSWSNGIIRRRPRGCDHGNRRAARVTPGTRLRLAACLAHHSSVFGSGWTQEHEQDFGQMILLGILLKSWSNGIIRRRPMRQSCTGHLGDTAAFGRVPGSPWLACRVGLNPGKRAGFWADNPARNAAQELVKWNYPEPSRCTPPGT